MIWPYGGRGVTLSTWGGGFNVLGIKKCRSVDVLVIFVFKRLVLKYKSQAKRAKKNEEIKRLWNKKYTSAAVGWGGGAGCAPP